MSLPTFSEYVAMREGLLSPTRPPLKGMPRLNPLPTTDAHRKRLHTPKPMKIPNPFKPVVRFKPTVRHVTEIVPQRIMPKLTVEWASQEEASEEQRRRGWLAATHGSISDAPDRFIFSGA
jgi:hypothetical protein